MLSAATIVAGCDAGLPDGPVGGSVALTVSLPNVAVSNVHFELTGNGFSRSGDIDVVAQGATASVLLSGVPVGSGYRFTLSATSLDGNTTCEGSTPVVVTASTTNPVSIALECRTKNDLGGVMGNATFNFCPQITSLAATPAPMSVGGENAIDVTAVAHDLDGNPLTYVWSAPVGTFDDASAPQTVYHCAAPGVVNVTATVTDGNCADLVTAAVVCLPFCATQPDGTSCDDHNACSRVDRCQQSQCAGGDPALCAALDGCHLQGVCDPGTGACGNPPAPDGSACDDQDPCTQVDLCQSGRCVGGNPLLCVPVDQCHVAGICNPGGGTCSNPAAPDHVPCQIPGATAACVGGTCAISSCAVGLGNCDGMAANGCETPITTNLNCGTCGHACGAGTSCVSGLCLPAPPTGVAAVPGGWKIAVSWTASQGATGYEVLRGSNAAGPFQGVGKTNDTHLSDLAVVSGTPSFYVVTASNLEGTSGPSVAASATALTKQICVNSNELHSILAFDASQSGAAVPVRTLGGTPTFGFPTAIATSLLTDEMFVVNQGGRIDVYSLGASGSATALRSLNGAVPGGFFLGLDTTKGAAEGTTEIFTAQNSPATGLFLSGGGILALDGQSGVVTRQIFGGTTQLGNSAGLVVDKSHGEILVGATASADPAANFSRVSTFDITGGDGNMPPKRVLGLPGNTNVGGWAIAVDHFRDQILTSCNCNNLITVFGRTAIGGEPPVRTLQLPPSVLSVYALLTDDAADTVWVLARSGAATYSLMEIPRGTNGSVSAAHAPIDLTTAGRLAPCN